jgi:hypothetical protein
MSNLLYNGTFSLPSIATNSYYYLSTLTTQQKTDFGWSSSVVTDYTSLQNGSAIFGYPNPSTIGLSQFVSLQYASYISQSFPVANVGNYILTFKYTNRPGYTFNNASVTFDGNVIGTVPTSTSGTWVTYSTIFNISSTGTHILKIEGVNPTNDLAIAITAIVLKPYFINNLKSTNVFGYLTVNDLNQNGVTTSKGAIETSKMIINGNDMNAKFSTGLINYNYSTLPARVSTHIGYQYVSNITTDFKVTSASFTTPNTVTSISGIPIGVYLVTFNMPVVVNADSPTVAASGQPSFAVGRNSPASGICVATGMNLFESQIGSVNYSFVHIEGVGNATFYLVSWMAASLPTVTVVAARKPEFKVTRIA